MVDGYDYSNFSGVEDISFESVRIADRPDQLLRLRRLKTKYDPANVFRVNLNIPPEGSRT